MAPTYTSPGVYIQEIQSSTHPITGVATSITAFVGYTQSGIDNRAQEISSFADFERLYGGLASNSELSYAVQQFFLNGGSEGYVVRTPGLSVGASPASVSFQNATFAFTALSSGQSANGNLLVDIDYVGLTPSTSSDPNAWKTVNVTITNLAGGTPESFPSVSIDSSQSNFMSSVINDPDTGSQLVSLFIDPTKTGALTSMAQTGIVGVGITPYSAASALCGTTQVSNVTANQGSAKVSGPANGFNNLKFGQWVVFGADTTPYQIRSIEDGAHLTLTQNYASATQNNVALTTPKATPTAAFGLTFSVSQPTPPAGGLPISVQLFSTSTQVPQTLSGLATLAQQAINAVLSVQVPGASVVVSVTGLPEGGQGLRINGLFPNAPDAVLSLTAPDATSGLTDCTPALGWAGGAKVNVAHYALGTNHGGAGWGLLSASTQGSDGSLPTSADLIGDPAAFTGIYALQKVDLFNLLCIPDATRANAGNPNALDTSVNPNAIYGAAIALCRQRRAMLLIDAPPDVNTVAAAVDWKSSGLTVVDPNGAAFFPRLRLPDPLNKYQLRTFAPCGVVAGVYATTDSNRYVWKAPAGIAANLNLVQSMVYKLNDTENGLLNPLGLNCFRTFPIYGPVLWGARTLVGADAMANEWKYVPVRRTALFIEESLYRGTQWVVFEPNDEPLWAAIRLNVDSFMQSLFKKGAFQGTTASQAYFVKCDSETTTQNDIDLGIVNILVGFAPLKPAEFVVIQIEQMTAQAQS